MAPMMMSARRHDVPRERGGEAFQVGDQPIHRGFHGVEILARPGFEPFHRDREQAGLPREPAGLKGRIAGETDCGGFRQGGGVCPHGGVGHWGILLHGFRNEVTITERISDCQTKS